MGNSGRTRLLHLLLWLTACGLSLGQTATRATTVPLRLPSALAYDASGNLYFAETANHVVRKVDTSGALTTIAGTGVQGFGGDNGPATAAMLDSPGGLAFASPGLLYVADSHNDRIRQVDLRTGLISTVAGTGTRGYAGDGGPAKSAALSLPSALAVDSTGHLYLADLGNHRVRRVDGAGFIATVAGNGQQGLGSDGGLAVASSLDSVAGLALDTAGNLLIADTHNGRVRRVDAVTGVITSLSGAAGLLPSGLAVDASGVVNVALSGEQRVRRLNAVTGLVSTAAGEGTQSFAGDGAAATLASLDSPSAMGFSPGGLLTFADTGNGRIRQVDAAGIIRTIAGLGSTIPGALTLMGPSVAGYGTGDVTATLVTSPATGAVTFLEGGATLGAMPLVDNVATLGTGGLAAGVHRLTAVYPGDALHGAAESGTMALTVAPAGVISKPDPVSTVYGQIPALLTGTLSGVLARDAGAVSAAYATTAGSTAVPGVYPITASLTGPAAGDYSLTVVPASVTVGKAASTTVATVPSPTIVSGSGVALSVRVASTTSGTPGGAVTLLDGFQPVGTALLVAGTAGFSSVALGVGTHTLTVAYSGDGNFLGSTSAPVLENIVVGASSDFTLVATGQTALTLPAGSAATYSFSVTPVGTPLSSPILLTASGLPPGASANFNPAYLPPGNTVQAFLMAVSTPKASLRIVWPLTVSVCLLFVRRRRRTLLAMAVSVGLAGCGDRTNTGAVAGVTSKTYVITVTGTATDASGTTLSHTAKVTLNLQ